MTQTDVNRSFLANEEVTIAKGKRAISNAMLLNGCLYDRLERNMGNTPERLDLDYHYNNSPA